MVSFSLSIVLFASLAFSDAFPFGPNSTEMSCEDEALYMYSQCRWSAPIHAEEFPESGVVPISLVQDKAEFFCSTTVPSILECYQNYFDTANCGDVDDADMMAKAEATTGLCEGGKLAPWIQELFNDTPDIRIECIMAINGLAEECSSVTDFSSSMSKVDDMIKCFVEGMEKRGDDESDCPRKSAVTAFAFIAAHSAELGDAPSPTVKKLLQNLPF